MGRNREPVALIQAKGKSHHLTKEVVAERLSAEVPVVADRIAAPGFLSARQKKRFDELAEALVEMKILSDADCDVLGRYIVCQDDWEKYGRIVRKLTAAVEKLIRESVEMKAADSGTDDRICKLSNTLERYEKLRGDAFKKCQECAGVLGMTVTARGKITLPPGAGKSEPGSGGKKNKFSKFYDNKNEGGQAV